MKRKAHPQISPLRTVLLHWVRPLSMAALLLCCTLVSSAQSSQQRKKLETKKDGEYIINVFELQDKGYLYEIMKGKRLVVSEEVMPQLGSSLAFKKKSEMGAELVKMAQFVVANIRENGEQAHSSKKQQSAKN